jgi:predicted Zn-dependent peptidase
MLERAKQQLKGSIVLGLESMSNRMQRLGRVELAFERLVAIDEVVAEVEAVTAEEVRALAEDLFRPALVTTVTLTPDA